MLCNLGLSNDVPMWSVEPETVTITCPSAFDAGKSGHMVSFVEEGTEVPPRLYLNRMLRHAVCYIMMAKLPDEALNLLCGTLVNLYFSHAAMPAQRGRPIQITPSGPVAEAPVDTQLQRALVNLLEFTRQPDEPTEEDLRAHPRYRFPE
jgi:predicted molibdopterin-dependent oxidoreductase YjgC